MKSMNDNSPKWRRGGRPPKTDPATFKYSFRLNAKENADFLTLFEKSGMKCKSHFISSCIFERSFKVMTVDKNTLDFYNTLKEIKQECRRIGVNYNQYIAMLRVNFTEQRAAIMSEKSAKLLQEVVVQNEKALHITLQLVRRWLPK